MVKYMGERRDAGGELVYVFLVNGKEKAVRQADLRHYPDCLDVLPAPVKAHIGLHPGS